MAVNRAKQRMLEGKPAIGGETGDPRCIIDLRRVPRLSAWKRCRS